MKIHRKSTARWNEEPIKNEYENYRKHTEIRQGKHTAAIADASISTNAKLLESR